MNVETEHDQTLGQSIDLSGRRILLAEDNELNWEVASELLSDLGVELDWQKMDRYAWKSFKNHRRLLRFYSYGHTNAAYDRI